MYCSILAVVPAPPFNVRATQAMATAPVEISWSPPSNQTDITGYRIFYNNGDNVFVPSVTVSAGLMIKGNLVGQSISIRTETKQLPSDIVNVTITSESRTVLLDVNAIV